jgi:hypothetical protein
MLTEPISTGCLSSQPVPADSRVLSAPDEGAHERAPQFSQDLVAIQVGSMDTSSNPAARSFAW